jgi:two-component system sensor histidine kinase PilS (NtrC family)
MQYFNNKQQSKKNQYGLIALTGENSQIKQFWFYLSRVLTAFTFGGILILVNILHFKTLSLKPLFVFVLFYSVLNFSAYLLDKKGVYFYLLVTDSIFATILIYFTGSHSSQFQFIYILIIIFAGFYLSKEKLYLLSSFVIVIYSTMLNLEFFKIIPTFSPKTLSSYGLSYYIGIHFISIFLISLIINKISEKLSLLTGQIKLKERKLKELMSLKNKIVDTVPSCMITTTRDYTIVFINDNAKKFFKKIGMQEPLQGDQLNNFIPVNELINEKHQVLSRAEYVFKSGDVIGYTISKMFSNNEFDGILLLFQDLTELKHLEKRVMFKNNLETLGEMAAGIAHEIRNPLASITGSVQLLKESNSNACDTGLLDIIEDELKRIGESVNNLLAFAKNDQTDPKEENLNSIVLEVITLFEKGLKNNIRLIVDNTMLSQPLPVICKKGRIKQVLWNILKNAEKAVEYTKSKKIYITSTTQNSFAIISIRDTGSGIEKNDIEKIFNPYFSKFAKGFGLGLSISKEIIEEMDGKIEVTSSQNAGTCFKIYIPLTNTNKTKPENNNAQ